MKHPPASAGHKRRWSIRVIRKTPQEGTANHSSVLARRTPWTEEPDGPQSMAHTELETAEAAEPAPLGCKHSHPGNQAASRTLSPLPALLLREAPDYPSSWDQGGVCTSLGSSPAPLCPGTTQTSPHLLPQRQGSKASPRPVPRAPHTARCGCRSLPGLRAPETTPCCPSQLPGAGCVVTVPKTLRWDPHPPGGEETGQTLHDQRVDVSGQRPAPTLEASAGSSRLERGRGVRPRAADLGSGFLLYLPPLRLPPVPLPWAPRLRVQGLGLLQAVQTPLPQRAAAGSPRVQAACWAPQTLRHKKLRPGGFSARRPGHPTSLDKPADALPRPSAQLC